jgi:hypothetical protein
MISLLQIGRSIWLWVCPEWRSCLVPVCVALVLAFLPTFTQSQQLLDYGIYNGYGLGKGILGNDYQNVLGACITGTKSPLPASHSQARVSIVYSADQYKAAFHIDQKAEASFLGLAGGGEDLHIGQETGSSGSAFDIIVEAFAEHDGETLDNIVFDNRHQEMIDSRDPAQIEQVRTDCGDRYIQTVFKETRLFAVLHVSSNQNSSLLQFSGHANAKIGLDAVSASGSLGGDASISTARQSGAVSLDIETEGLGFTPTVTALQIANSDGLVSISDKLSSYLATLQDKGQPVKYLLTKLPGLPSGDLTNDQIVNDLTDLKASYYTASYRLNNVKSLLQTQIPDPRRSLFTSPEAAGTALNIQQHKLMSYLSSVANAHHECAMALTLSKCASVADSVGGPPARTVEELSPELPPVVGLYQYAINGRPVPPGNNMRFMVYPGTLLDQAKEVQHDATELDVLAPIISGDYLSFLDVIALSPAPPPYSPNDVGGERVFPVNLIVPSDWKASGKGTLAIYVAHADAGHPCAISTIAGLSAIDLACLTPIGRVLRDVVLATMAQHAINHSANTYDYALTGVTTNCFGHLAQMPVGTMNFVITAGPNPNEITVTATLKLPMGEVFFPMVVEQETHDLPSWHQIADDRLAGLKTPPQHINSGSDPCTARVN